LVLVAVLELATGEAWARGSAVALEHR